MFFIIKICNHFIFNYINFSTLLFINFQFFFIKYFEHLNIYTYIIFLLNNVKNNFFIIFILFIFIQNPNKKITNLFLVIYLFNYVYKMKIKIKKNNNIAIYNYSDINLSLIDGLIQVHPPMLYLSIILLLNMFMSDFFLKKLKIKNLKNYKKTFWFFLFSLLSGGYWSYSQILWGNWWTWDNIELFLLFLIIFAAYQLHCTKKNFIFFLYSFNHMLILFFIFLFLRGGYIQSKHNFFNLISTFTLNITFIFLNIFLWALMVIFKLFKSISYTLKTKQVNSALQILLVFFKLNFLIFLIFVLFKTNFFIHFYLICIFLIFFSLLLIFNNSGTIIKIHFVVIGVILGLYTYKVNLITINTNNFYIITLKNYSFLFNNIKLNFFFLLVI